ncbi:MAG: hypothetical protein IV100_11570 [Myxococcales bacterium]|nr:hypothetical protein [Myxococcales bacterium]
MRTVATPGQCPERVEHEGRCLVLVAAAPAGRLSGQRLERVTAPVAMTPAQL